MIGIPLQIGKSATPFLFYLCTEREGSRVQDRALIILFREAVFKRERERQKEDGGGYFATRLRATRAIRTQLLFYPIAWVLCSQFLFPRPERFLTSCRAYSKETHSCLPIFRALLHRFTVVFVRRPAQRLPSPLRYRSRAARYIRRTGKIIFPDALSRVISALLPRGRLTFGDVNFQARPLPEFSANSG